MDSKNQSKEHFKIFISHANADKQIVGYFIELLYAMGLEEDDIFYS